MDETKKADTEQDAGFLPETYISLASDIDTLDVEVYEMLSERDQVEQVEKSMLVCDLL